MNAIRCASGLVLRQPPVDPRAPRLRRSADIVRLIARFRNEDPVDCLARLVEAEAKKMTGGSHASR